jgi:hypothetical protein
MTFEVYFNLEGLLIFNHIVHIENIAFARIFSTTKTTKSTKFFSSFSFVLFVSLVV